ncbi:hypothetical protein NL676_014589 [Syzygium grande]|nr:hypothetical protein NL676_014589 [Syzygium grande]
MHRNEGVRSQANRAEPTTHFLVKQTVCDFTAPPKPSPGVVTPAVATMSTAKSAIPAISVAFLLRSRTERINRAKKKACDLWLAKVFILQSLILELEQKATASPWDFLRWVSADEVFVWGVL